MNERIKELMDQAWRASGTRPDWPEKFAELIVRECIGIVKEYSEDGPHCQCQMIKQHFGVK